MAGIHLCARKCPRCVWLWVCPLMPEVRRQKCSMGNLQHAATVTALVTNSQCVLKSRLFFVRESVFHLKMFFLENECIFFSLKDQSCSQLDITAKLSQMVSFLPPKWPHLKKSTTIFSAEADSWAMIRQAARSLGPTRGVSLINTWNAATWGWQWIPCWEGKCFLPLMALLTVIWNDFWDQIVVKRTCCEPFSQRPPKLYRQVYKKKPNRKAKILL